jgi:hypothetical protein
MFQGTVSKPEPDNRFTNELCAIANATETTGPPGVEYWGWDDKQCGRRFPFMCRIIREWPALLLRGSGADADPQQPRPGK